MADFVPQIDMPESVQELFLDNKVSLTLGSNQVTIKARPGENVTPLLFWLESLPVQAERFGKVAERRRKAKKEKEEKEKKEKGKD